MFSRCRSNNEQLDEDLNQHDRLLSCDDDKGRFSLCFDSLRSKFGEDKCPYLCADTDLSIYDEQLKLQCGEIEDELKGQGVGSWEDHSAEFDKFVQATDEDCSGDNCPIKISRSSLDKDVQSIAYKKCFGEDMPDFAKIDLGVYRKDKEGKDQKCSCEAMAYLPAPTKGFKSVVPKDV